MQPQNTIELLGQGPSLPRNAPVRGVPHGVPLLTPSPLPRAAFQLEEAKHPTFPAHQRAGDQQRSHLWLCNQRLSQKTSAGEPDLDGHQQLQPFHTPCHQSGKPKEHLGMHHTTSNMQGSDLVWVPSAKAMSLGGMGYGCTTCWDILRAGGAAKQHWCWNSGFPQQVLHRG